MEKTEFDAEKIWVCAARAVKSVNSCYVLSVYSFVDECEAHKHCHGKLGLM